MGGKRQENPKLHLFKKADVTCKADNKSFESATFVLNNRVDTKHILLRPHLMVFSQYLSEQL